MKLECTLTQMFGANANSYYKDHGQKGHTGVDETCGYGTDIHSYWDMRIYKVLKDSAQSFDGSGYLAPFGIVDNGIELFEAQIGHCSEVLVDEGDLINKGDVIAKEGNTGVVYMGGVMVTKAQKAAGSKAGSHRHVQIRPVKRVTKTTVGKQYLSALVGGQFYDNGFYYEYWNANNGYAGADNPLNNQIRSFLSVGMNSYQVFCLQRFLTREGIDDFKETGHTGYFGPRTFSAVREYQKRNGIMSTGFVGPMTLSNINMRLLTL